MYALDSLLQHKCPVCYKYGSVHFLKSCCFLGQTQEREEDQRTLNLIGESLHLLGNTLVALSDLRCNLSAQPPRHLHVVRPMSHYTSPVVLQSGMPHIPIPVSEPLYVQNYFHTVSIKQSTLQNMSSSRWTWAPLWPWLQTADRQVRVRPNPHSPATNRSHRVRHLLLHRMEPVNRQVMVRGLQEWSESLTKLWNQWSWCRWTWMVCQQTNPPNQTPVFLALCFSLAAHSWSATLLKILNTLHHSDFCDLK